MFRCLTALSADEFLPEGWIAGGKECGHCPYTAACGRLRHAVPFQQDELKPDPQFVAEIADLAREAKQREAEANAAGIKKRELQHQIKERLRSRGLRRVIANSVSVTWSPIRGRQYWDHKGIREAAAKAGVDLAKFETIGEPTDRLIIQVAGQSRSAA